MELVGTAGVGKSRLLDAAWSAAEGLTIYQGACTPYGAAVPYSVYRPLMRSGSGIPVDASAELTGNRLTDIVAEYAPDLAPMLPLLALPFGARVPSTPEADAIDREFRRLRVHEVVVDFLDATLSGPILLVVEDAHWIDDASGDLTNHLVRASQGRPWAGIITRRPEGSWTIPDTDGVVSLHLEPLDDEAIRQLAIDVSTRALADRDLDVVADRAQGNPLFAVELARALSDATSDDAELPDTIEQIIASRFDRLDPSARKLIRVASVLGNQFHEAIVGALLSAVDRTADVGSALDAAMESGAIAPRAGSRWGFNHALYRDTAYQGLPFRQRKQLHRLAAEVIEERAPDTTAVASLLSLHYSAARAHEEAWRYSRVAARIAQDQNATSEAASALLRAHQSGPYCRGVNRVDRVTVAEELGDLYYVLGNFDDAERSYRSARRSNREAIVDARLMRKMGSVRERQGRPQEAIRWLQRASERIPSRTRTHSWLVERAHILLAEAGIRAREGKNDLCVEFATRALADAERIGDESAAALALERIHVGLVFMMQPDTELTGPRALAAHRSMNDSSGTARILINLGVEAYFDGDWDLASRYYLEALEVAQAAGSVVLAANAAINSAEVLADQGDWQRAIGLIDDAIRNYEAVGYAPGIAAANLFAGVAAMRDGQIDDADDRFDRAGSSLVNLGMDELLEDLETRRMELDLLAGCLDAATCEQVLERFGDNHPLRSRVLRLNGLAAHQAGDSVVGLQCLTEALELEVSPGFDRALTLRALALVAPDHHDANDWAARSDEMFVHLGVRRPPPMPTQLVVSR